MILSMSWYGLNNSVHASMLVCSSTWFLRLLRPAILESMASFSTSHEKRLLAVRPTNDMGAARNGDTRYGGRHQNVVNIPWMPILIHCVIRDLKLLQSCKFQLQCRSILHGDRVAPAGGSCYAVVSGAAVIQRTKTTKSLYPKNLAFQTSCRLSEVLVSFCFPCWFANFCGWHKDTLVGPSLFQARGSCIVVPKAEMVRRLAVLDGSFHSLLR